MMRRLRFWQVLFAVCLAMALTGCAGLAGKPAPSEAQPKPVDTVAVKVYFGAPDAEHLAAEISQLNKDPLLMQRAMETLIAGPKNKKLWPVLPSETKVRSIVVKDKIAQADFSAELTAKKGGGSAQEILAVSAIVYTLTEFPGVERVQILVEGKKVATLYGHMDLSEPLTRMAGMLKE
jgi:spore germination protein GerM